MRVLVVDDDDFDVDACRQALEALCGSVATANTPEEALERLEEETVEVLITDYDLKAEKNGIDLLAYVRTEHPHVHRILMSGLLPPKVLDDAKRTGDAQAYLEKPHEMARWKEAVAEALAEAGAQVTRRPGAASANDALRDMTPPREDALAERVRWLSAVVALGAAAHSGQPLQDTFDQAVRVVSETLEMEYVKILELLPGGDEVLLVAGVGWREGLVGKAHVSTGMDSQAGYTLASDHAVVVEDLRAERRFSGPGLLHEHGVVSGVSVIIPGEDGRPWGVFGAHTKARRRPSDEHVLFLQAVSNVVAGAVARDRTERTLRDARGSLERQVAERTRELRAAVDDLQAFNAMVAHDLRAPLRLVSMSLERLVLGHESELSVEARQALADAGRAADQMRLLLEDLLAFAKAAQDPLQMRDVDVTQLVTERWAHVRRREPARDVRLDVEPGMTAHADPRLLAVALDNLLANALKFTRGVSEARIEVGAVHLPAGGTAFFVKDNGAGFQPERAPDLFQPFKRLHSAREFEGTGVGLATTRRIVERHKGRVWAESAGRGEGATFYFRLLPAGLP